MATRFYTPKPKQIIEGQNIDQQKLMSLLRDLYGISSEGKNNFRVEVGSRSPKNNVNGSALANHSILLAKA
jgi:hypothetical protein